MITEKFFIYWSILINIYSAKRYTWLHLQTILLSKQTHPKEIRFVDLFVHKGLFCAWSVVNNLQSVALSFEILAKKLLNPIVSECLIRVSIYHLAALILWINELYISLSKLCLVSKISCKKIKALSIERTKRRWLLQDSSKTSSNKNREVRSEWFSFLGRSQLYGNWDRLCSASSIFTNTLSGNNGGIIGW